MQPVQENMPAAFLCIGEQLPNDSKSLSVRREKEKKAKPLERF